MRKSERKLSMWWEFKRLSGNQSENSLFIYKGTGMRRHVTQVTKTCCNSGIYTGKSKSILFWNSRGLNKYYSGLCFQN